MNIAFIDSNNLGYRAFHTTGHLTYGADLTGVAFGFLNQVFTFMKHAPAGIQLVFCWDSKESLRKKIYSDYKRRDPVTSESYENRLALYSQFDIIRKEILPALGWTDCWLRDGYEADDLISWGCKQVSAQRVIVSGDEDLYQCLNYGVRIFNPGTNEFFTDVDFGKKYGVTPDRWAEVKAIAGCKSDNISGAFGVGEKTVIRYFKGLLKPFGKPAQAIAEVVKNGTYERNYLLVKLPFGDWRSLQFGVGPRVLKKQDFLNVFEKYGMKSFIKRMGELSNLLELT